MGILNQIPLPFVLKVFIGILAFDLIIYNVLIICDRKTWSG